MRVTFANSSHQDNVQAVCMGLTFDGYRHNHQFYALDTPDEFDMILGQDWIELHKADLLYSSAQLSFTEQGSSHKHTVPVPHHLKHNDYNSMINNTIADVQEKVRSGENDHDADGVDHMFIVYVTEQNNYTVEELDVAVAALVSVDNMMPHCRQAPSIPVKDTNTQDTQDELHVEDQSMHAEIRKLVQELSDRFPAELPDGLPPERPGIAHAIPLKPGFDEQGAGEVCWQVLVGLSE